MTLNSIYSLTVEVDGGALAPIGGFHGAFLEDSEVLSWVACNTRKYRTAAATGGRELWTLLSTAGYGRRNKAPQVSGVRP